MTLNIKRLYIHEDNVDAVTDKVMVSAHKDEVHYAVRGNTIGEVVNNSKGWLSEEAQTAIAMATATMRKFICDEILKLPSMVSWVGHEDCIKVAMAHQTVYVILERPSDEKPSLGKRNLEDWPAQLNAAQDIFEFGAPNMNSYSFEGCTIQVPCKLLKHTMGNPA